MPKVINIQMKYLHRRKIVPELSRFEGMIIYLLFRDNKEHNKPHVHVYYGEYKAA